MQSIDEDKRVETYC